MTDSILLKIDAIEDYQVRYECLNLMSKAQLIKLLELQLMENKKIIKRPYLFNEHFSKNEILGMVKRREIPAEVYLR